MRGAGGPGLAGERSWQALLLATVATNDRHSIAVCAKACFFEVLHLMPVPQGCSLLMLGSRSCFQKCEDLDAKPRLFASNGCGSPMLHAFSLLATTSSNFILVSLLLLVARLQAAGIKLVVAAVEFVALIRSGLPGKVRVLQDDSKGCMEEQPRERERERV